MDVFLEGASHLDLQGSFFGFCELMIRGRKRAGLTQMGRRKETRPGSVLRRKTEGGERRQDIVEFIGVVRALDADLLRLLRTLLKR